jgi:outer membrane protein assembly factor BamC
MKKCLFLRFAIPTLVLFGLSGCSTIKSWFPDKERDYQFTTEIPELVVPDDLKAGGLATAGPRSQSRRPQMEDSSPDSVAAAVEPSKSEIAEPNAETQDQIATASETKAVSTSGISSLQIDQPKNQAARIVARAMSRQKLEIVERNIDKGYFYVKYDPNAVQAKDETILDELNFIFGEDPSQELEYRVSLQAINPQLTEVTVQDSEGKPLSTAPANGLLKLITDAINQDIPTEETQNTEQEGKSEEKSENIPAAAQGNVEQENKPTSETENPDQKQAAPEQ